MAQITLNSTGVASNGTLALQSNGTTTAVTIDASQNVGIGTASPSVKLEVAGAAKLTNGNLSVVPSTATSAAVTICTNTGGTFFAGLDNSTGGTFGVGNYSAVLYNGANTPLVMFTNGAERARIDSSGNVGIGTTSPSTFGLLAVKKDQIADTAITVSNQGTSNAATTMSFVLNEAGTPQGWFRRYRDGTGNTEVGFGDALLFTGNVTSTKAERARIDSSGNLGIGTTSPSSRLHVTATASTIGQSRIEGSGVGTLFAGMTAGSIGFLHSNTGTLAFGTSTSDNNLVERARINSSGNLLVGTTTNAGSRVFIYGDGTNPAFRADAATSNTSVYAGIFRHESTTAGAYIQFVTDSNVETGRIFDSAGTMQYASSSDARLKTNVQPLQDGLSSVLSMNPCTYDMRRGEATTISSAGLIAQEVYEIYPHAVGVGGDDENTNPWSVDYGKLTPLLIKAIQEQQALITQLQADVAALKGASA